ncbi:MAG TPA: glycerol-3-phosphate responsive antiterminator [Rubrobacteraceae bacterium]|jgi:glycerol uptake operon antiterminator|nr:glycerol-3-phosphate responsive antiterminator [Rubrobacteraceae bacterium]
MGKGTDNVGRFLRALKVNPVIPAVRGRDGDLERALAGDHAAIFVLGGDVFQMLERVRRRPYRRPFICVNVDMVGGVASDPSGIRFLAREVDGVISTHRNVVQIARSNGALAIQRLFAIDTSAVERGLKVLRQADPDAVEILPGLAFPEIVESYRAALNKPVLAGGLIKDRPTAAAILEAGAVGVSTSDHRLWKLA